MAVSRHSPKVLCQPRVSCIMPTHNRRQFMSQAIRYFMRQDYADRELIIVDDGDDCIEDTIIPFLVEDERIRYIRLEQHHSLGAKRNLACEKAKGEVIVHWDDDDWMASWRLSYQLEQLQSANADICGLDKLLYFNPVSRQAWEYLYPRHPAVLLAGGSLCYRKEVWQEQPFEDTSLGEDTAFIRAHQGKRILALEDNRFYVALNHDSNTSPRNTTGKAWRSRPYEKIVALLGEDQAFYSSLVHNKQDVKPDMKLIAAGKGPGKDHGMEHVSHSQANKNTPLISCIMMTRDRPVLLERAITYFLRQDYANKELLIVDDGKLGAEDNIPTDAAIRYIRLDQPLSLGQKRNLAVQESHGSVIAHWDDDDWYAPDRLQAQLTALFSQKAKICGFYGGLFYEMQGDRFWAITPELHSKMYYADIHGRSIMYSRDVWDKFVRYPDRSLGEDAGFLKNALARGVSLVRLENDGHLISVRHGQNTWVFNCGDFIDPSGWQIAAEPGYLPREDRDFYRQYRHSRRVEYPSTYSTQLTQSTQQILSACHVTVSLPYHGCADTLRKSVDSILTQTHKELILVVINDGDTPPWDLLNDIEDPRLVRFDLSANYGRYFADAVVLNACQSPYFLIQDADDWSEPDRIRILLHHLRKEHAVGAISAEYVHHAGKNTGVKTEHYHTLHGSLDEILRHRANHHGLYRSEALRRIGGYYGGFRMGYDTLLINLLQMTGRLAYVEEPAYHRVIRPGSLSNSAATGIKSRSRQEVIGHLSRMYADAFLVYQDYLCGEHSYAGLCSDIRTISLRHVPLDVHEAMQMETERLQKVLSSRNPAKEDKTTVSLELIDDPRIPWTDWSLDKGFSAQMITTLEHRLPESVLEVGAGATTFLLAGFAARTGARFTSLEHDPVYYEKIKSLLEELDLLKYVDLRLAPLEPYRCADGQDYPWYKTEFTDKFDFVLLDGPPERYGRQAGLFALQSCLADNGSIWLHDGNRPHEHACIKLWREHYSFISTLSQADPKGVFCLSSSLGSAALLPIHKRYSSGMGIALLTGDRPELLRQTVESFNERYPDILQTSAVVALVNGRDNEAEYYLQDLSFIDCVLSYPHEILPIGSAAGYLANTLASYKGVEFIFHLEDDWFCSFDHADWLQQAQGILQAYPDIGQIRIRHQNETVLCRNMATEEPIRWVQDKAFRFSPEAHFTFNPNLMRVADLDKIYPARTEYEAQLKFHQAGFSGAQLLPGCFQHIGTNHSRRVRLEKKSVCA